MQLPNVKFWILNTDPRYLGPFICRRFNFHYTRIYYNTIAFPLLILENTFIVAYVIYITFGLSSHILPHTLGPAYTKALILINCIFIAGSSETESDIYLYPNLTHWYVKLWVFVTYTSYTFTRLKWSLVPPDFKECCKRYHEIFSNLNKKHHL